MRRPLYSSRRAEVGRVGLGLMTQKFHQFSSPELPTIRELCHVALRPLLLILAFTPRSQQAVQCTMHSTSMFKKSFPE
jgi:hypothetical protein